MARFPSLRQMGRQALNSPNDVVVKWTIRSGSPIPLTDRPPTIRGISQSGDRGLSVYRVDAKSGAVNASSTCSVRRHRLLTRREIPLCRRHRRDHRRTVRSTFAASRSTAPDCQAANLAKSTSGLYDGFRIDRSGGSGPAAPRGPLLRPKMRYRKILIPEWSDVTSAAPS